MRISHSLLLKKQNRNQDCRDGSVIKSLLSSLFQKPQVWLVEPLFQALRHLDYKLQWDLTPPSGPSMGT